jgi:ribonuclease P/MRP protein subunit RPP40
MVLNGKFSSREEVFSGVLQGSVLGPLLFVVFINNLNSEVEHTELIQTFVDDTKTGLT